MSINNTQSLRFDEQFAETYPIAFGTSVAIAILSIAACRGNNL
jgi:hypothetical protein